MATISVGGLATGLDTNRIIDQLLALERRPIGLLETQRRAAQAREIALQTFNTKVLAFRSALDALRTASDVLVRRASSSNTDLVSATAGSGATPGVTTLTVHALAKGAIATAANGVTSADATVASGSGSFSFRVGSGDVETVEVDATTTLGQLAAAINDKGAGATATVVNVGTAAAPDYRLRLASDETGTSHDLTIVTDDTTLGVAVTQAAENASFSVSGFTDPLTRERNSFDDVIPGVTLTLSATGGPVTVTVGTDVDGVTGLVQAAVTAFNDIVSFVASESVVSQDTSNENRSVSAGPLAFDGTVRSVLDGLRTLVSTAVEDLPGGLRLLADVGITTTRDGTLAFDASVLASALASNPAGVGALFGGTSGVDGAADRLHDYVTGVTQAGGLIDVRTGSVADQIKRFEDDIARGERNLDKFEETLRAQFAALEVLVSNLQSQGAFLQSILNLTPSGNTRR